MSGTSWPGIYPGTVVDDQGEIPGDGKLRIRVDQVYGAPTEEEFIANDQLPWARPCFPEAYTPAIGEGVWVTFWAGDPSRPVWLGGWFPTAKIPAEFASSASPGPRTRLIRTPGGHTIEMRYKAGQEHVHVTTAGGQKVDLIDAPALGGPKVRIQTPGNVEIVAVGAVLMAGLTVQVGAPTGTKYRLVDERFLTAFNAHTHLDPQGGITGPPVVPVTPAGNATVKTTAD